MTPTPRLGLVLTVAAFVLTAGAIVAAGLFLRHDAVVQRQTLRTHALAFTSFKVEDAIAAGRSGRPELDAATAAFRRIERNDPKETQRIGQAFAGFVHAAQTRDDRQVEAQLAALESKLDEEFTRQDHSIHVTTPRARIALIVAIVAAALLVGLLLWQFELQRRAGRVDRDYARRSDELMRLRDEFVASVSHELRTPLTSIMGYIDLLRSSEQISREQAEFLGVVERNADRLLQLVSDLLLVAELESRTLELHTETIDLKELARECIEAAEPAAEQRGVHLVGMHASPGTFDGDRMRLAQMMDNLVSNAIKFTPPGGTVTVTTAAVNGTALFEVRDTGVGMSPADRDRAFDRFYRAGHAAEGAVPGTGLGLPIVKAIVEAHNGSIDVESALGAGTTIRVRLPRGAAHA